MQEREACNACGGARFTNTPGGRTRCWKCDGNGYTTTIKVVCNRCDGNGKIPMKDGIALTCPSCQGAGELTVR